MSESASLGHCLRFLSSCPEIPIITVFMAVQGLGVVEGWELSPVSSSHFALDFPHINHQKVFLQVSKLAPWVSRDGS